MLKKQELSDPQSCLNKAKGDEMIFVLRGSDPAAPEAIGAWIAERVKLGLNQIGDDKIREAGACAWKMRQDRHAERQLEIKKLRILELETQLRALKSS